MRFGLITDNDTVLQAYQDMEAAEATKTSIVLATSAYVRRELGSLVSARIAETVEEVCEDPDTDAVYVSLTVGPREAAIGQALAAGKHVLVAGPWDAPLAEGQALCALAQEREVRLGIAAPWAVNGAHQATRTLLQAGQLGEYLAWRDDLLRPQPLPDTLRQALRPLALFAWLTDLEAEQVYAQEAPSAEGLNLVAMQLRYTNGCIGSLLAGRGIPGGPGMHPQGMRLVGSRGQLDLTDEPMIYRTHSSEDAPAHSWRVVRHTGQRADRPRVMGQFAARVLAGQDPPLPACTALDPLRILDAVRRSLAEDRPVDTVR